MQLAGEERPGLVLVAAGELEAVRPVDRERVDAEPLQRLEDRLAGAPVERHALLHLGRLGRVLQQKDVGQRVPGADHRDARAGSRVRDLVTELVDLRDGLLQVLLVDLVGGDGAHRGSLRFSASGLFPWPGRPT